MCKVCKEIERKCTTCGIVKPIEDFSWTDSSHRYRRGECKCCKNLKKRAKRKGTSYEEEWIQEIENQKIEQERKELEAQGLRRCTCEFECNQIRPIEEFEFRRGKYTNLRKECKKRRHRGYYKKNPEPAKENAARWREENPEKCKEHFRQWRQNNRERHNANAAKWKANNREKARETVNTWRKNNLEKVREYDRKRKQKIGQGYRKNKTVIALYEEQQGICPLCNQPLYEDPLDSRNHVDHIYPVSKAKEEGWTKEQMNDGDNLQLVHDVCNVSKGNKIMIK